MHTALDRLGEIAMHGWSLAAIAVLSSLNFAAGVFSWIFAAEVSDGALVGVGLFVLGTATAIAGWALVLLVKLTTEVATLKSATEDHERRIGKLEP